MDNFVYGLILGVLIGFIVSVGFMLWYGKRKLREWLGPETTDPEDPDHLGPIYDSQGTVVFEGVGPPPGYEEEVGYESGGIERSVADPRPLTPEVRGGGESEVGQPETPVYRAGVGG